MKNRAFTLIELLVVIAIIALLMSILMPALSSVKERARQQACAARVRQQLLALTMYANEHNGSLPLPSTGGNWLHDLAINTVNFMLENGMTQDMFYCPSNQIEQKHPEYFWEFTTEWNGKEFVDAGPGDFIISSYNYVMETRQGNRPDIKNVENKTGPKKWCKTINDSGSALRELVVDAVPAQVQDNTKFGFTFSEIAGGGIWATWGVYETTNHLKNFDEPHGSNIGFLDCHVEWRRFEEMEDRFGNPTHYWW